MLACSKCEAAESRDFNVCEENEFWPCLCVGLAILKFIIVIEKAHSCFKSQSELRISPVGSVNIWFSLSPVQVSQKKVSTEKLINKLTLIEMKEKKL